MKLKRLIQTAVALAVAVPAAAMAQDTKIIYREEPDAILQIGGGVSDFTTGLDSETNPGAGWDVRAIFGAKSPIGMEAAYFGNLNDIKGGNLPGGNDVDPDGIENDRARLMTNGAEALLRANFGGTGGDLQPYVAAGIGVANHSVIDDREFTTADDVGNEFDDSTDIVVPAAAGLDLFLDDRVTVGGRVGYKYYFDNQVVADEDAADVQAWSATARLGVTF